MMAYITPSSLRREEVLRRERKKYLKSPCLPIYEVTMNLPNMRSKPRNNPSLKIMDDFNLLKVNL